MSAEDDWSDSDDEILSEVETSVTLGVPDGPLLAAGDVTDAAVSRIGGLPAFLVSPEPSLSSSQCKICSKPMELLVQIWCPFKESPMDRALYVWGCATATCQKKNGSIRAWRGLRFNAEYAAKLEQKIAKRKEKQAAKVPSSEKKAPVVNPFSMGGATAMVNPFGLGAQVFGAPPTELEREPVDGGEGSDAESTSSEQSLITALASTTMDDSPWKAAPQYPAQYLSTSSEYIIPEPKRKFPSFDEVLVDAGEKDDKGALWSAEAYENSLHTDQVFEKFSKRVENEPEQCIRYELKGTPLPFCQGAALDTIFPAHPPKNIPVTKGAFKVIRSVKRSYTTEKIPKCPSCGCQRVFECQLMPNLINVLKKVSKDEQSNKLSDEERRNAVEAALKGGDGMDWGTAMVFSCGKDCADEGSKAAWREEHIIVQWDV